MNTGNKYYTLNEIKKSKQKIILISRGSYIETKRYFKHYCYHGVMESRQEILKDRRYVLKDTYYQIPYFKIISVLVIFFSIFLALKDV